MCGVLRLSRRVVLTLFYALLEQAFVASCKYNFEVWLTQKIIGGAEDEVARKHPLRRAIKRNILTDDHICTLTRTRHRQK